MAFTPTAEGLNMGEMGDDMWFHVFVLQLDLSLIREVLVRVTGEI